MDPEIWKNVECLFHEAIELPLQNQRQFVLEHVSDDGQVAHEVLSLLASHHNSDHFLESANSDLLAKAIQSKSEDFARSASQGTLVDNTPALSDTEKDQECGNDQGLNSGRNRFNGWQELVASQLAADFEIEGVISSGGMGTVLRATDRKLNRPVAIKVISASEADEADKRRFIRESKIAASIASENVVTIYSVSEGTGDGAGADSPTIVMELLQGQSVRDLIKQTGTLPFRTAATIAHQTAKGLAEAHRQKLIHRDIKPANLMLVEQLSNMDEHQEDDFKVKIIDFGIARDLQSDEITRINDMAGTPSFMSPEQIFLPASVDHRCDIYATGATLYQMLTGEPPYRGAPHTIIRKMESGAPVPPRRLDDRIPIGLENICLKALSYLPARRYQSATEMAEDLQRFLDGKPTLARPVSQWSKLRLWQRRNRGLAIALSLLFVSLLAGTIVSSVMWNRSSRNASLATSNASLANERADSLQRTKEKLASSNLQMRQALDGFFLGLLADESQRAGLSAEFHYEIMRQMTEYYSSVLDHSQDDPELVLDVCDSVIRFSESILENGVLHKIALSKMMDWVDEQLNRLSSHPPTARSLVVAAHNKILTAEISNLLQGDLPVDLGTFVAPIELAKQSIAIKPGLRANRILLLSQAMLIEYQIANNLMERTQGHQELTNLTQQLNDLALQYPRQLQLQFDRVRFLRWQGKIGGGEGAVVCRQKCEEILRAALRSVEDDQERYVEATDDSIVRLRRLIGVNQVWMGMAFARIGKIAEAHQSISNGIDQLGDLQTDQPSNIQCQMDIAEAEFLTANLHWFSKESKKSLEAYDRSLNKFLAVLKSDPSQMGAVRRVCETRHQIAKRKIQIGETDDVAVLFKEALADYRGLFARSMKFYGNHDIRYFQTLLADAIEFFSTTDPGYAEELKVEQAKFLERFNIPTV